MVSRDKPLKAGQVVRVIHRTDEIQVAPLDPQRENIRLVQVRKKTVLDQRDTAFWGFSKKTTRKTILDQFENWSGVLPRVTGRSKAAPFPLVATLLPL